MGDRDSTGQDREKEKNLTHCSSERIYGYIENTSEGASERQSLSFDHGTETRMHAVGVDHIDLHFEKVF